MRAYIVEIASPFLRKSWGILALIGAILILASPILTYPLGSDQGEFAIIGREILAGQFPYVDVWNPKPPAIFYLYSLMIALFGATTTAVHMLDLLVFPIIALSLYVIGQRLANQRVGLMAVALFGMLYFTQGFWSITQNDLIAILPMTLAVVCVFQVHESGQSWLWAGLCGVFSASALWFKYPYVFFILALVIGYWMDAKHSQRSTRDMILDMIGFSIGGCVVGFGGMLVLASGGALEAWIESIQVTSNYTRLGFDDIFTSVVWQDSLRQWLNSPYPIIVIAWPILRWVTPRSQRGWHIIILWFFALLLALLSQAKGYNYHLLPMLAPFALFGADALDRLGEKMPISIKHGLPSVAIGMMLLILVIQVWMPAFPYLTGGQSKQDYYKGFVGGYFNAGDSLAVADYLRTKNVPRDSLFIWGFRPEIYFMADLRPATRFIFQFPLIGEWYPSAWRDENVALLWASLPPYAIVAQADYIPWVTGRDEDSKMLLEQDYIDLLHWYQHHYVEDVKINDLQVYRRRDID